MRHATKLTLTVLSVSLLAAASAGAQQKPAGEQQKPIEILLEERAAREAVDRELMAREMAREVASRIPLQIQVVVSRYQGEKKVSSLPYTISVNANDRTASRLRMGARVPVSTISGQQKLGMPMLGPVTYEDIGTNIDCLARTYGGAGQFELVISVEDKSVYPNVQDPTTPTTGDLPVFRSFQSSNTLILKDGQSRQFTAATDRVSGEVIRVEVTLTVAK